MDVQGQATFEVLAEEDFNVYVDRLSWKASARSVQLRERVSVPAGTNAVPLKFVINSANDISALEAPENVSAFHNDDDF